MNIGCGRSSHSLETDAEGDRFSICALKTKLYYAKYLRGISTYTVYVLIVTRDTKKHFVQNHFSLKQTLSDILHFERTKTTSVKLDQMLTFCRKHKVPWLLSFLKRTNYFYPSSATTGLIELNE